MIPVHMPHKAERTRTRAEERSSDMQTSEIAAAPAEPGSFLTGPVRALRCPTRRERTRSATGQTLLPTAEDQLLEAVGSPAVSRCSFPRWWTFDGFVPGDGQGSSDKDCLDR